MSLRRSLGLCGILFFLAAGFSGCGYTATRILPTYYRTIYIEPFQNKIPITKDVTDKTGFITNFPELEQRVTREVINQFLFDGNLRVTHKPETADLVLTGSIFDFYRQALRRQASDNTVDEYRLNLSASLTLREKNGKLLLQEPAMVGDSTYFVTGPSAKSESAAVDGLVTDFSRRVVEWVIEYW